MADNQQKAVLSVWWSLVQAFWKRYGPDPIREEKLSEAIKQWCLEVTKEYEAVSVYDFTSSWRDGYAFNCLLHSFDNKLVDLSHVENSTATERIENAFSIAEKEFKVARLLSVKDLHSEHLDSHSVVCYLMTLYLSLLGKSSIAALQATDPLVDVPSHELSSPQRQDTIYFADDRKASIVEMSSIADAAPTSPSQLRSLMPAETSVGSIQPAIEMMAVPIQPTTETVALPIQPQKQQQQQEQQQLLQQQQQQQLPQPEVQHQRQQPQQCSATPSTSTSVVPAEVTVRTKRPHEKSIDQPSTESEMRSRKSSSSSQISSKSKRARKEEMTREFENCLEQVLTWLLEAEEELNLLENVNQNDLKAVRKQFKDFELFMASLTESQDTVGRVLHRGQLLCGKAENEDERIAIEGQLRVVNGRWEALRELSMQRQNELQLNINKLQNLELESIDKWLGVVELEMTSCEPLAATAETAIQQIEAHSRLQSKIHDFQDTINDLSSFVAVVDDVDSSEERIGALEQRLQSIGDRWRAICEWAEVRATQLDGLAELCAHTNEVFEMLNEWLKEREHELLGLKSAHHLEDSQQVAEQIRKLQHAETALEAEHSSFVKLSQLSCELVARLEKGNSGAANDVRRRLDTVTQRWDNLVARIEEHSRTLVQSGKADVRQIKRARELPTVCPSSSHEQKAKAAQVVKQNEAPLKAKPCETLPAGSQETTDTESEEAGNQIVERFLRHVAKLTTELEPLRAWSASFTISKKPDQVRKMINVCQEKLIEIKEQEARVNRLQLELEHMHLSSSLSTSQLKKANDAFETFAKNWAKIVTKISEAMNVLTGQDMSDKETRVAKGVEQWIESCDKILTELAKIARSERVKRLAKLQQQLETQNKNITFIEKDPVKRAILKKGLDIVRKRIEVLTQEQTTSKTEAEVNVELENKWCTVGDVDLLDKEVQRAEKIVELARKEELSAETIEKAETRLAEMIEKRRATIAALEKMKAAEEGLQSIAVSVEATSSSDLSIGGTIVELEHAREQLTSYQTLKKEAERAAEKMLALDDNVPQTMLTSTRNRIRNLSDQWRDLENAIEDHLNCARKEHRRSVQKKISNEERFLEELEKRLTDSERASDAEECCEHLDNLESLLEKVDSPLEVDESSIPSMDESFVRESYLRLNETRRRLADATRERIAALSRAVADCEHFEKQMADVQQWSSTVSTLLDLRKSSDVSALDVPDEYKSAFESGTLLQELAREFEIWSTTLEEIGDWLQQGERRDNERFHDQFTHAKNTLMELSQKFANFKHPRAFEEKLERTFHKLGDIEISLDDMTGIEAVFCSETLDDAKRLVKKLISIEEDVHSLEKGKEQLIQEGIFNKDSAFPFTEKIRLCKKKTKELGMRAEDTVERLEDCVETYGKLLQESEAVEIFLDGLDARLEKYATEDKSNDEEAVQELVNEWNRHEASLRNLEELERVLREYAVKVSDSVCAEKRRRADALKMRLDGWTRTVQEMNNDEETLLMEVDELHGYLVNELDKIKDKEPEEIASSLRFLRGDRDRLSSRARKLAAMNPRLASAKLCSDVAERWQQLESRLHSPPPVAHSQLQGGDKLAADLPFHQKIDLLRTKFDEAKVSLDFDASPVNDVYQWEKRVKAVDDFLNESQAVLNEVIETGRNLANSGRMELDTHCAIEKLDEIVAVADQLEMEIESQKSALEPLFAQAETLDRDREAAEEVVDSLAARNLDDPAIANATRQDLADRDSQFAALSQRAAKIHAALPGKSSSSRDTTLTTLGDKLSRLESILIAKHVAPSRAANATPIRTSPDRTSMSSTGPLAMEVGNVTDAYTTEEELKEEDHSEACGRTNAASVVQENILEVQERKREYPVEHAVDVQEISMLEDDIEKTTKPSSTMDATTEKSRKSAVVRPEAAENFQNVVDKPLNRIEKTSDYIEKTNESAASVGQPTTVMTAVADEANGEIHSTTGAVKQFPSSQDTLEKVYMKLDEIEDTIAVEERFPMEGTEDFEERYKKMSNDLEDALTTIDEHQMTMGVLELSHTHERIQTLKNDLAKRKKKVSDDRVEWKKLQQVLSEIEKNVTMGDNAMDSFNGRETSPRLQELEESQRVVEEMLPRTETLVCDAVRRLGIILPRLKEDGERATTIRRRVRDAETRFRDLVRATRESRIRLDARAVDQSQLRQGLENLQFWLDETATELESDFNPYDLKAIEEAIKAATSKNTQIAEKKSALVALEMAKERLVAQASVDPTSKHEARRGVSEVAKRIADIRSDLVDRLQSLAQLRRDCESFWRVVDDVAHRGSDLQRRTTAINEAVIFTPSPDHVMACRSDAAVLKNDVALIKERVQQANASHEKLGGKYEKKIVTVITLCNAAIAAASALAEPVPSTALVDSMQSQNTVLDVKCDDDDNDDDDGDDDDDDDDDVDDDDDDGDDDKNHTNTTEIVDCERELTEDEEVIGPDFHGRFESISESTKDDERSDPGMPRLNARDSANWQMLTQLRHWLSELERDASLTVDLCDRNAIRDMANTVQGIMEQIRMKIMDVVAIQDISGAILVKHRARELVEDMERVARQCNKRHTTLLQLAEQSRAWGAARDAVELWMHNADAIIGRKRTKESTDSALRDELTAIENLINELEPKKEAIKDVNAKGNAILDTYIRDDAHTMSHELSKLNMRWSKFNDNLRIRRAVLEATLRSHNDFNTAFSDFEEWLKKIATRVAELETLTQNTQALKDTAKRHEWIQQHKDLENELNAHESVLTAVDAMGQKLCTGQESGKERSDVQNRLNAVCQKWKDVRSSEQLIGTRLTEAEQEWEKLTYTLSSLIGWIEDKSKEMLSQQPVGGCLSAAMAQSAWLKSTEKEMEVKGPQINEAITNAHSFLMQHDLRPKIHRTSVLAEDDDADKLDVVQRRCGLKIHADCEKLKEKWAELGTQLTDWDQAVHAAALRLQELERALAECQLHLSAVESEVEHLRPVERLRLEELKDARRVCESLAIRVGDLRIHVDDANDACGRVLAADAPLDQHPRNQLDVVNERFLALKTALRVRSAALRNALADFGPSSEHFLNQSVALPWQRAISKTNHLPYYIDHTTEKTQWEHPVWVEMTKELSQFNRVKFIAYRTAMKLRALQKRLCLDLIDIPMLEKCFSRLVGLSNEESPGLESMVSSILPLFEQLNAKYPQMVRSVALAVDLCINFLLNLFDPSRDGLLRVLSFKIALIVLSSAPLEEKYRFLFNLVAQDGQADQKHIALLLYDLIQIPRLVGEAAAFGGSNVEPSVRSCFEMVRLAPTISLTPFLEWMKQEPQSVVWLPVMHRLATAEFAKHQAKCNVCKMFPIVGLRYRCLRCFNLDLCQNCFFSQRTAKKHKLKHPMQEYAVPTTSAEDARDFARMVRNKFSRSKNSLGYLPVDVTDEGRPLAAPPPAAQNPATEALHQRSATLANRLALLTASLPAEPRDERIADIQSPAQIINQVEQMQKDELDQVLQRLQLENLELKRELERRKLAVSSTPDLDKTLSGSRRSVGRGATLPRLAGQENHGRSVPSLQNAHSQNDVMDEARALRLHKQRLEHRSRILEQQNEQLELQLRRLKKVIEQQKENGPRTQWSAEPDLATERRPNLPLFATPNDEQRGLYDSSSRSRLSERTNWKNDGAVESENRTTRMQSLLATVDDLGRAMENLVVSVVYDSDQEQ